MSLADPQVLAFALVAALMTVSPGADTFLVVRNTLRGGRDDGWLTVAGICCGLFVHALLSALGVSAILMHSATAFLLLKAAGACYLAWLGIQSLRSAARVPAGPQATEVAAARVPAARCFREGFLTNLLNPKVIVFYLALLPQFISPGDAVLAKSLLLTAIHFVQGILWLGFVAWGVDRSRRFFLRPLLRRWMDALCGMILLALGVKLAFEQR
ncbi:MAG TPA: LysE family translocator [Steroidobacteraceae bacterium]|nr:LysE family translocator [Steroidobacteraceae bacterium]